MAALNTTLAQNLAAIAVAASMVTAEPQKLVNVGTTASPTSIDPDAAKGEDFSDYKRRLLRLVAEFRRDRTTLPDIEEIFGMTFREHQERYNQSGWIVGVAHSFRSLRMNHRVSSYYDPARGRSTINELHFETQYYVNFSQAEPPMAIYTDEARCLSVSELQEALSRAKLNARIRLPDPSDDRLFLSVGMDGVSAPAGMFLLAMARVKAVRSVAGSRPAPNLDLVCVESVEVS